MAKKEATVKIREPLFVLMVLVLIIVTMHIHKINNKHTDELQKSAVYKY